MARIRSIKPETWQDQKLAGMTRDARLLFIGLWSAADDEGRLRGHPAMVKAAVFPYDSDIATTDIERLIAELQAGEFVTKYAVEGQDYIWVRNFNKHQKIDHASRSPLPAPPAPRKGSRKSREDSRGAREDSPKARETLAPDQGAGKGAGSREQGGSAAGAAAPVQAVYGCWREFHAPKAAAAVDEGRAKIIAKRLAERVAGGRTEAEALQDLLDALTGWKNDDWALRPKNSRLDQLLGNADDVDKGLSLLAAGRSAPMRPGGSVPAEAFTRDQYEIGQAK